MIKPGIRLRIFLAIMAVISGLLVLTGWVMGGLVDTYMDAEIADTLQRGRRTFESFAAVHKTVLVDQASSLAQTPHLRAVLGTPGVDEASINVTLASLGEAVQGCLLFVTDGSGRLVADNRDGNLPEIRAEGELRRAMDGGVSYSIWNYGGEVCFVALSPINVASTQLGVLGLGYPIANQVRELSRATGLDVTVLHDERVVACSRDEARGSTAADGAPSSFSSMDWSQVVPGVNSRLRVQDREVMATSVVLAPSAYRLVLTRPLDHLMMPFQHAKTELALIAILIASVALLVSRWVAGRIASPIRSLTEAAGALAHGDLTAHVDIASTDEVGTLGRTFNSMARQLEAAMHDVVKKARAAEEANEAKSAFLATISHELRTPLNAVLGFNEQLQATSLSAEQRDFLQTAQRSGEDLLGLIDKLLDFARMESGDFRIDHIEFDLYECIRRTVETMSAAIRGKGLVLDMSIDAALPRTVLGPGRPVRQVLSHYLSNAAKFTASGTVRVRATLSPEHPASSANAKSDTSDDHFVLLVEVEDTGIGVPADRIDQLFKPFSQLENSASRSYAGTGVGLAIVKDLARLMGGDVGVRSEAGVGSTFWFTAKLVKHTTKETSAEVAPAVLPVREPKTSKTLGLAGADAAARERRSRQRILIVEDNPVNQKMASVVLKKAGWPHEVAEDGRRAVERASSESFDLILMDCQMPGMDGFEATRCIRGGEGRTPRSVPIIALTANAFDGDREACLSAGMDDFLAKPFKAAELVPLIERWIELRATVA
jgi:signal transduction histidine kinase/ActR/RegA family two-component response regulator